VNIKHRSAISVLWLCAGFVLLAAWGCSPSDGESNGASRNAPDADAAVPAAVVHLFFADVENEYLTAEARRLPHQEEPIRKGRAIVEALIDGPRQPLVGTVPSGTTIRAFYITEEKVAYVDLSRQVYEKHPGGATSELMTIYSIVNSLALNIPEIDAVKILIEGRETQTLAGHIDLRLPFEANMMMVR